MARFVDVGEVVLYEKPFVHVLLQKHRKQKCDWCFNESVTLKRCTACQCLYYCSVKCQREDWSIHKMECKCLKAVLPKIPQDSVRLLLRIVLKQKINLTEAQSSMSEGEGLARWDRSFEHLMTNSDAIRADDSRSEIFVKIAFTLKELCGDRLEPPTAQDLFMYYCKMAINSFTICDSEMQGIGTGIYLRASRLDHSCQPNTVTVFSGTSLCVRTTEKLESSDPSQLRISYINQMLPTKERREQLSEQYYFHCDCPHCQDNTMDLLLTSVQCPNCGGPVHLSDQGESHTPCNKCGYHEYGSSWQQKVEKTLAVCREKLKEAEELNKEGDPALSLEICKKCLQEGETILYSHNIYRVQLLDLAMDSCIKLGQFSEALDYGQTVLQSYSVVSPPYNPVYGVHLLKVGKLQLHQEQLQPALQSLQQAEAILRMTHGTSHDLYHSLASLLDQCVEELRVLRLLRLQSIEETEAF